MNYASKLSPKTILSAIEAEKAKRSAKKLIHFVSHSEENYKTGWVHEEICAELENFVQDVVDGKEPRLMIFVPPRHGKSFIVSERLPAWVLGKYPKLKLVVSSYGATLATKFSKRARDLCSTEWYKRVFPSFGFGTSTKLDDWDTVQGGSYRGVGVGGGLTGDGAHILIVDDPIKDWEEAYSANQREKVWNWFTSTAYTRLMPGGGALIMLTRWHRDDIAGRILEHMAEDPEFEQWKVINYPAIAEEDERHRKKGEALHPQRYSLKSLKNIMKSVGERVWTSLYQQKPRKEGGRYIKSEWFKRIHVSNTSPELKWVRFWDLAIKAKKSNDNTASAGVALHKGIFYIRRITKQKTEWPETKRTICNIGRREEVPIGIENVAAMEIAVQEVKKELKGEVSVKGFPSSKDKLTRALPWIDLAEQGKVYLVEEEGYDWIPDFLAECEDFDPMQPIQTDDQIDAVSGGYVMVRKKKSPRLMT